MVSWIEALKIWNAEHNAGKWCVAKKGSPEYDQVKAIMARGKEHVKTGKGTKEMMEHLKAKRAAKESKKPDEADAVIAEMDEILKGSAKPAASEPKAPQTIKKSFDDITGDDILVKSILHEEGHTSNMYYRIGKKNEKSVWLYRVDEKGNHIRENGLITGERVPRASMPRNVLVKEAAKAEAPSSVPKAPSRDVAGEMALIHQIAAAHAKRYGEDADKRKKVMTFLKAAAARLKEKRAAREAAAKPAPRAASPPRAPRRSEPDSRSRSTAPLKGRDAVPTPTALAAYRHAKKIGKSKDFIKHFEDTYGEYLKEHEASQKKYDETHSEQNKVRLYHNIALSEETLQSLEARLRAPGITVAQRAKLTDEVITLRRTIAKMRKMVAAL